MNTRLTTSCESYRAFMSSIPHVLIGGNRFVHVYLCCVICMCEYEVNDKLRILPRFHEFHSSCIDRWIQVGIFMLSNLLNENLAIDKFLTSWDVCPESKCFSPSVSVSFSISCIDKTLIKEVWLSYSMVT